MSCFLGVTCQLVVFLLSFNVETTQDVALVELLASLANTDSPAASQSQQVLSELSKLEEQDSVLSQLTPSPQGQQEDKEETLEMSQRIWDQDSDQQV